VPREIFRPLNSSSTHSEREYLFAKHGVRNPYVVVASASNWIIKNLETALQTLEIARRKSGIDFQTVAYGPEEGLNVALRRNSTFDLDIHRVGYLSVDDLAAIFRNAELFLCTSLYEGFGLPILEAMACGCPVVTSNAGSLAEVAGDGAQTFDSMDAHGMAQAAVTLLRDPEERERWRKRAFARAADFSWRKAAEQTLGVYRDVYESARERRSELAYSHEEQSSPYQKAS
jgi:glycosyltransferase involved in cell wall biosynthesis